MYPLGIAPGTLVRVEALTCYVNHTAPLSSIAGWMTPDAAAAFEKLKMACAIHLPKVGLFLSDCYRSWLMQAKAHADHLAGAHPGQEVVYIASVPELHGYIPTPKRANSPPPGNSWHEAGRAFDVDMDPKWLGVDQRAFADIAHSCGWKDIVHGDFGNPARVDVPEEWHWQFPGPYSLPGQAIQALKAA